MFSRSQIISGEHTGRSLKELFEYSDDNYTSFLTEDVFAEFSESSTESSPPSLLDFENIADVGIISPTPYIVDNDNPGITSYMDYLNLSTSADRGIDRLGEDFFLFSH